MVLRWLVEPAFLTILTNRRKDINSRAYVVIAIIVKYVYPIPIMINYTLRFISTLSYAIHYNALKAQMSANTVHLMRKKLFLRSFNISI